LSISRCRLCGHELFPEPLLRYTDMPKGAQFFPDAHSLQEEKGVDLEVCQCLGCGLVQLSNEPVPYYREVIRAAAFSEEMRDFRIRQFGSLIEEHSLQGKKIIEIGCGRGEYLSILRQFGAHAYGLEQSEESVIECVENDLAVSRGFIDASTYKLEHAPFDAFFILNFLEHLPELNSTLGGIYNNLAHDALGFVEVPNFDMILQKNLFSEFIPDHLFYFTKQTLKAALVLNGFDIVECREVWHDYIILAVVRKRPKHDLSRFYERQANLQNEIESYIQHFGRKNVAIWGAGHQALAVICLAGLADKIKYVVDSAKFKQDKYTPASHLPIVPPDRLSSDPVDAIIIMAAAYSDEVARIVRQRFSPEMGVAILRDCGLEIVQQC
jgi:2-polyprenyl-3-methyl-5-hydroxy-6-metoxy-1,4-benzoquinol methylase